MRQIKIVDNRRKTERPSPGFYFSEEPVKSFAGELVFYDGLLAAESGSDEGVDESGGVDVGRDGKAIYAFHDHQLLAQF